MGFFSNNKNSNQSHSTLGVTNDEKNEASNLEKQFSQAPEQENKKQESNLSTNTLINNFSKPNTMQNITTISTGTILEGSLNLESELIIEGTIKGSINSKSKVTIGTNGKVEGDINCMDTEINGHVMGKVHVKEMCFLKGNAKIDGDIFTNKLVIEDGVQFNGKCSMGVVATTASNNANKSPNAAVAAPSNGVVAAATS